MRTSLTLLGTGALAFAAAAAADVVVWRCGNIFFADGNIYRDADASSTGMMAFPARQKFPLNIAVTPHRSAPYDPVLLAAPSTSTATPHAYTVHAQHLYLDNRPGAFAPVSFVADNGTLAPGQTTWGFYGAAGFLVWSNTGDIRDVGPKMASGATRAVAQQGYSWQATSAAGVTQLFWNQTQWAAVVQGGDVMLAAGNALGACTVDADPELTMAEVEAKTGRRFVS